MKGRRREGWRPREGTASREEERRRVGRKRGVTGKQRQGFREILGRQTG